jgi:hypothetical protein
MVQQCTGDTKLRGTIARDRAKWTKELGALAMAVF